MMLSGVRRTEEVEEVKRRWEGITLVAVVALKNASTAARGKKRWAMRSFSIDEFSARDLTLLVIVTYVSRRGGPVVPVSALRTTQLLVSLRNGS